MQQIKTLFRYLQKKGTSNVARTSTEDSKSNLTVAAKVFVSKQCRCHQRSETYYRLNKDWLDRMIQQEMDDLTRGGKTELGEDDGEESGEEEEQKTTKTSKDEARRRGWNLKVRNAVIKRHFDAALSDDLRAVAEAIIQEKEEMDRAANLDRSGRALARDPALRKE